MLEYPPVLPLDAAQLAMEIVKARAVAARKQEFGLAMWNVQGYTQRVTLGMPALPGDPNPEETIPQIEDAIYALEEAIYEYEEQGVEVAYGDSEDGKTDNEAGSILVVLAVISTVAQLINLWRNREREELPGCDDSDCECDDDLPAVG